MSQRARNAALIFLDPEWREKFLAEIRQGIPPQRAAEYLGVPRRTLYDWFARGDHPNNPSNHTGFVGADIPENSDYVAFVRDVLEAQAECTMLPEKALYARAKQDADYALRWLKARHPDEYQSTQREPQPAVVVEAGPTVLASREDLRNMLNRQDKDDDHARAKRVDPDPE